MVVQGQLVKTAVRFSDLYEVFLLNKVRDKRQRTKKKFFCLGEGGAVNFWTKNPNLKKKLNKESKSNLKKKKVFFFCVWCWWCWGGGRRGGGS